MFIPSLSRHAASHLGAGLVLAALAGPAAADDLPRPKGRVVLTLSGQIDQPMAVRDKGPLFVVYPFDSKVELRSSVYYERSIWQLKRMSIE